MKTSKILSLILAVCMLFSVVCVNASAAEGKTYTASGSYVVTNEYSFNPDTFKATLTINQNKVCVLDGNTVDYTYDITSFKVVYVNLNGETLMADHLVDPEAFFAVFTAQEADAEYVKEYNAEKEDTAEHIKTNDITLVTDFSINFPNKGMFGTLEYNFVIEGFSAPATSGLDFGIDLGGVADAVKLPVDLKFSGVIDEFPSIATSTVLSKPQKTSYYDSEKFDATGLEIAIVTTDGDMGTYTYNEDTAYAFSFNPSVKENLSLYDSEVVTYLNGIEIIKTPITVNHKWSDGYVNITTDVYTETKPGYHAIVCEGCGEKHDAQPHVVDPDAWTYNNDQTFMKDGTESNICLDCGTVLTRNTHGTADYNVALGDFHFIQVILDYINMLLNIIGGAVR